MKVGSGVAAVAACVIGAVAVAGCGSSASTAKGAGTVSVTLVDAGCTPSQIKVAAVVSCPNGDTEDQGRLVATGHATALPSGASTVLLAPASTPPSLRDVDTLNANVHTIALQPAQLANGAVELMNEVAKSKITGEEDRYSHTDLSDFQGNLSGSREAFQLLAPALRQTGHGALTAQIATRFAAVQTSLDRYRRHTALGYAPYTQLTPADRQTVAAEVDALDEPLSTVAATVSGA